MIHEHYRPSLRSTAVLYLQRVPCSSVTCPVEWSLCRLVVTAQCPKSGTAAPVRYGQMSVMLQSLPASCGLPVASLKSQPDSYGQLPTTVIISLSA
ncbi:hypothetical protein Tco_0344481 [Tanacetum coccineum]